mmetsp:Transcript_116655/g.362456  ORF Transcript_116655/g.362456 Transcript_116655/m.362456 type:complete len:264 (+) Transcript_116655:45-836(+)
MSGRAVLLTVCMQTPCSPAALVSWRAHEADEPSQGLLCVLGCSFLLRSLGCECLGLCLQALRELLLLANLHLADHLLRVLQLLLVQLVCLEVARGLGRGDFHRLRPLLHVFLADLDACKLHHREEPGAELQAVEALADALEGHAHLLVLGLLRALHVLEDAGRRGRGGVGGGYLRVAVHLGSVQSNCRSKGLPNLLGFSAADELVVISHHCFVVLLQTKCEDNVVLETRVHDGQVSLREQVDDEGPVHRQNWWLRICLVEVGN